MATAAVSTPDSEAAIRSWRITLTILGVAGIVTGIFTQLVAVNYHQVTTAIVSGTAPDLTTRTVTGPSAPPATLITALFGAGIILLTVAAFFPRITKVVFPGGGELDFETNAALAGVIATKTSDPAEAQRLYMNAAPRVAAAIASKAPMPRVAVRRQIAWNTQPLIDKDTMNQIVDAVRAHPD